MDRRLAVSKILKYSGTLKALRLFAGSEKLRVLMYHRVFDKGDDFPYFLEGVAKSEFEKQMGFLAAHFSVISIEEAVGRIISGRPLPKRAVSVTIDDGYRDCYDNIYPVLKKYGLPATIYLTTDNVDSSKAFWADKIGYIFKKGIPRGDHYENKFLGTLELKPEKKRLDLLNATIMKLKTIDEANKNEVIDDLKNFFHIKDNELRADYNLTWAEVKEMSGNGIYFGAHTLTHPILTRLNIEIAEREILESRERIQNEIGKRIYGFCYPNGTEADFNDQIIRVLKNHDFKYAVTTRWGFNDINSDLFRLNRIGPNCDDDVDRFECIISGGFEVANKARKVMGMKI